MERINDDSFQVTKVVTVSVKDLLQKKAFYERVRDEQQRQIDKIDEQLKQASDLGVASATAAVQIKR